MTFLRRLFRRRESRLLEHVALYKGRKESRG